MNETRQERELEVIRILPERRLTGSRLMFCESPTRVSGGIRISLRLAATRQRSAGLGGRLWFGDSRTSPDARDKTTTASTRLQRLNGFRWNRAKSFLRLALFGRAAGEDAIGKCPEINLRNERSRRLVYFAGLLS